MSIAAVTQIGGPDQARKSTVEEIKQITGKCPALNRELKRGDAA
ncbi:hypothetical protein RYA07_27420 [Pseudomonas syringae pv. actinidiae]|nr:hypothetical protein [Pseudomonas syringae]MDU8429198.1 hypothetical protein [Pseudomonas syringae pv. actinidifoliorum]MDU8492027.1 hypothetical protein [Pseudomonas syringae pv. actinidiae]MDU8520039.1 hypothetical protein [Pseudomonas syringae pv. actinidifoliorum]MDU8526984.1 hypothetical protein [Pseudomonas syringae pv. actinidifoliorum]GKQ44394.1 hypothetical protein PSTH2693_04580 [Pseudomonas syringae pv. theae]